MNLQSIFIRRVLAALASEKGEGQLTILQFHKIPKAFDPLCPRELLLHRFETVLDFFAEYMRVLPLTEAIDALRAGSLPPKAVALTFDDGYEEWNEFVAPALLKRELPATFYVTTGQIDGPALWHERIAAAVQAAPDNGLQLPKGFFGYENLASVELRAKLVLLLQERLKYLPLASREQEILKLEAQTERERKQPRKFSADHVRELHSLGFEIGAHTAQHPILKSCSDAEALQEIGGAKESLESIIKGRVTSFAYPNGLVDRDFIERDVRLVKACGYQSAVITGGGVVNAQTDPYLLPRFTPWGPGAFRMAWQVSENLRKSDRRVSCFRKKKRVMVVECGAGFGGAVIALETLIRHMPVDQIEYDVVTNLPVGRFAELPAVRSVTVIGNHFVGLRNITQKISDHPLVPARKIWLFSLGRLDDVFNRIPYLVRLLVHAIRTKPDVIHGNNEPSSNREAMLLAKLLNKPYIQHLRGPIAQSRHTPWLLGKPDVFIPVSRWLAEELVGSGVPGGKIHQIYDAVDFDENADVPAKNLRAMLGLPEQTMLIAMIGMLMPWKGQSLFLDAVARMEESPDVVFLIIGGTPELADGEYENELRQKIEEYGLNDAVVLTGKINGLQRLVSQIDVVVSCSMEPEPLGLVMLEGMASGCLFVGPAFGAAIEVVENGVNGLLFEPRSAIALADKLNCCVNSKMTNTKMGVRARADVRGKFHGKVCAEKTLYVTSSVSGDHSES